MVFITVKRHNDHRNSYKGKPFIGLAYSFRDLVHYYGEKHGSMQAHTILEEELRVLHLDLKATGNELSHIVLSLSI